MVTPNLDRLFNQGKNFVRLTVIKLQQFHKTTRKVYQQWETFQNKVSGWFSKIKILEYDILLISLPILCDFLIRWHAF